MKKLNPAYVESIIKIVNECPYFSLLSMEVKSVGLGESHLTVAVNKKHLQPFHQVHGGVYASLIDAAAWWAVYPQLEERVGLTTVELKINYLAPLSQGRMIAKGRSIKVGKKLCLGEASIEDETGRLLAHGTETMMVLKDLKFQNHPSLPTKFQ
jgi:uncharacterized protein (TIGR00369 family)